MEFQEQEMKRFTHNGVTNAQKSAARSQASRNRDAV
jgi:hypothetical protein